MGRYIFRRILSLIPVLIGVSFLVFIIMHLAPGDPAEIILGPKATTEALAELRSQLGLDLPWYVQYLRWIGKVFVGDWGRSIQLKREVLPLILDRFGATAILALGSMLFAVIFGLIAGIVSAIKQYTFWDRLLMLIALVGFCLPVFWLGIILQIIFGLKLGVLPVSGMHSPGGSGFLDMLRYLILPSLALAAGSSAVIARMTRSSILEVIRHDYIRTAKAKGLPKKIVIYKHALKNALIPVLTVTGLQVGYVLAGAVLVEIVLAGRA